MADPLSVKIEKPTFKILKERAKKEEKTISQLVREFIVLSLAKSTNGGRK